MQKHKKVLIVKMKTAITRYSYNQTSLYSIINLIASNNVI